jgi:hypothetical protein
LESKTLHPVWYWNYVDSHLPPRRAPQAALYCPVTLGYKSVSIYSSRLQRGKLIWAGLSCLVLHAVFMSLGPHVRSGRAHGQVVGSSGRSGPPVGDGWDPGRWGPMGTHVCQAPDRRVGEAQRRIEVTSMRSEDVASVRSRRVHGDQKRKSSSVCTKVNIKSLESRSRGLKWRQDDVVAWRTTDLTGIRWSQHTFKEGLNADQREVERRRDGSVLPVGRGDVEKRGRHKDALVE